MFLFNLSIESHNILWLEILWTDRGFKLLEKMADSLTELIYMSVEVDQVRIVVVVFSRIDSSRLRFHKTMPTSINSASHDIFMHISHTQLTSLRWHL